MTRILGESKTMGSSKDQMSSLVMFYKCAALSFLNIGRSSDGFSSDACAPWICSCDQRENKQDKLQITFKKKFDPKWKYFLTVLKLKGLLCPSTDRVRRRTNHNSHAAVTYSSH